MRSLGHPFFSGLVATLLVSLAVCLDRCGQLDLTLDHLERWTADARFELRGQRPTGDEVVILAIDDKTRSADPHLVQRRANWASIVERARGAGARVIGIDAFFSQPERPLPAELQDEVARFVTDQAAVAVGQDPGLDLLRRVDQEAHGDDAFAAAMRAADNVVLSMYLRRGAHREGELVGLDKARYGQDVAGDSLPPQQNSATTNIPVLSEAAKAVGLISVVSDSTQTVREIPLALRYRTKTYAALSVRLVAEYLGVPRARMVYDGVGRRILIGDLSVPLDDLGCMLLNFRGARGRFVTYPLIDLIEGRLPEGALRDRIVLIGATYYGHDVTRTPLDLSFPGVELHATAIDNILRGDWLRRSSWFHDLGLCLLFGLLLSLVFGGTERLGPRQQLAAAMALLGAYLLISYLLFSKLDLWVSWIGPLAVALVASPVCLAAAYLREGLQRARLRKTFSHYLSEDLIGQLLADPSRLVLGGERRDLTVLFSDIRNFTSLSEQLDPDVLVSFLNSYLTPMTRSVLANGGYLDKYIGDAIMAVFGAPVPAEDHARRAVSTAIDMQLELNKLRQSMAPSGIELSIGIGINSGEMVVGNMGSQERFDYTAIGDAVNLASRLEGLCKIYGVDCIVGEEVARAIGSGFRLRSIDRVRVKGKQEPVEILELLGDASREVSVYRQLELFDNGLRAYRAGEFRAAREAFGRFAADNPADKVAALYLRRLEELGEQAPPDWDGVAVLVDK